MNCEITVTEGRTTFRVGATTFGSADVDRYPRDSLSRSVAYSGLVDPQDNALECTVLRKAAAGLRIAEIRRNQLYANCPWGSSRMEKLLRETVGLTDALGNARRGEALAVAVWERLQTHDGSVRERERTRISTRYGLDVRLAAMGAYETLRYMPKPTRKWAVVRPDGTLDRDALTLPYGARQSWTWETTGDVALLDAADLDLLTAVCASAGRSGALYLLKCSDPSLEAKWKSAVEERGPAAKSRDADGPCTTPATPEVYALFDAGEDRLKKLGWTVDRHHDHLNRYQYQKWPISTIMFEV